MNCKEGTRAITLQITSLLSLIDERSYALPLEVFQGSTLGQHFRHILDFYICILGGAQDGFVDYAARKRDPRIEEKADFARSAFEQVLMALEKLDEQKSIQVKADFSSHSNVLRPMVKSSIGRELMFAYDHAIHHLAMIRIGIHAALPDLRQSEDLGLAPSTIKYRAGEQAPDH